MPARLLFSLPNFSPSMRIHFDDSELPQCVVTIAVPGAVFRLFLL